MVANTNLPHKNKCPSASVSSIDSSKSVASSSTSPKPTKRLTNMRPKLIRKKSYSFDLDTRRHSSTYQTQQLQENQSRLVDLTMDIFHEKYFFILHFRIVAFPQEDPMRHALSNQAIPQAGTDKCQYCSHCYPGVGNIIPNPMQHSPMGYPHPTYTTYLPPSHPPNCSCNDCLRANPNYQARSPRWTR